jgi:hypothetical protein
MFVWRACKSIAFSVDHTGSNVGLVLSPAPRATAQQAGDANRAVRYRDGLRS